jgi:adenosine deaminase
VLVLPNFDVSLTDLHKTDDVGIFGSPVSNEYLMVALHFGLSRGDLIALSANAVNAIFSGEKEKERMRGLLKEFEDSFSP